jgi:hypothetical protein
MKPLIAFNLWQWIEDHRRDFEPLEHRSSIAPSPLAGEGWDGGAEAGTDSERHAWPGWPHPHPCPPPSRGREFACTVSPNDYLTDVLVPQHPSHAGSGPLSGR